MFKFTHDEVNDIEQAIILARLYLTFKEHKKEKRSRNTRRLLLLISWFGYLNDEVKVSYNMSTLLVAFMLP